MTQMIVRAPQFYADPLGNPAEGWLVYVGAANLDPKQEVNKLVITDGVGGDKVSNPYTVKGGRSANANGQYVTPVISAQEYSIRFESPNGGTAYEIRKFIGDGLSSGTGGTGGIPDVTFNNLQQALATDLTGENFLFIKATNSGWEGTATGADISSFYYRDGTTGSVSSGDADKFYDLAGNGFKIAVTHTEAILLSSVVTNTADIATNAANIATRLKSKSDITAVGVTYTATRDANFRVNAVFRGDIAGVTGGQIELNITPASGNIIDGSYASSTIASTTGAVMDLGSIGATGASDILKCTTPPGTALTYTGGNTEAFFKLLSGTSVTIDYAVISGPVTNILSSIVIQEIELI